MKDYPRRTVLLVWLFIGIFVGCQQDSAVSIEPTSPPPIDTPIPEPSVTDVPLSETPTPVPSDTPEPPPTETVEPTRTRVPLPTPFPAYQAVEGFNFSREGVGLDVGRGSSWDSFQTIMPDVFYHDGLFHMFYIGTNNPNLPFSVGYATSADGLSFSRHPDNPILEGSAAYPSLVAPEVYYDGSQWVMYVNGGEAGGAIGSAIIRATAPELHGPWRLSDEELIPALGLRPWDRKSQPSTIFETEDGLGMYYMGIGGLGIQMGLAFSPDGLNWTRYNDPATDDRFELSDPILPVGPVDSWDIASAGSLEVIQNPVNGRWEMFYSGSTSDPFAITRESILTKKPTTIGFASSEDGISWSKHPENPVITILENCWPLIGTIFFEEEYYVYYDRNCGFEGITVLRGTIVE